MAQQVLCSPGGRPEPQEQATLRLWTLAWGRWTRGGALRHPWIWRAARAGGQPGSADQQVGGSEAAGQPDPGQHDRPRVGRLRDRSDATFPILIRCASSLDRQAPQPSAGPCHRRERARPPVRSPAPELTQATSSPSQGGHDVLGRPRTGGAPGALAALPSPEGRPLPPPSAGSGAQRLPPASPAAPLGQGRLRHPRCGQQVRGRAEHRSPGSSGPRPSPLTSSNCT